MKHVHFMITAILIVSIGCTKNNLPAQKAEQQPVSMEEHIKQMEKMYPTSFQQTTTVLLADETTYYLSDEGDQSVFTPNEILVNMVVSQLKEHHIPYTVHKCSEWDYSEPVYHIFWDKELFTPVIE